MNFTLSDEQNLFAESLDRVLRGLCPPRHVHDASASEAEYDAKLWKELCDFGLSGLLVPPEFGGSGLEMIDLALAAEILGFHAAPVPFLGHALATLAVRASSDESLKATWLPKLADGSVLGTVALGEGDERWLPEQWTLDATGATLTGTKNFVPSGLGAQLIVVGLADGKLALVLPDAEGAARHELDGVDRTRRFARLEFSNTPFVPLVEAGSQVATRLIEAASVLLAADAFGGGRRVLGMAVDYANEREQFGVKIATFQALRHQLANIALEVEPCRALYWYAAHAYDHLPDTASTSASLAKAHIAERFMQASRDAVEAHGGIGFTWEYDLHLWFKRAMFDWSWAGSPSLHRERYATLSGW